MPIGFERCRYFCQGVPETILPIGWRRDRFFRRVIGLKGSILRDEWQHCSRISLIFICLATFLFIRAREKINRFEHQKYTQILEKRKRDSRGSQIYYGFRPKPREKLNRSDWIFSPMPIEIFKFIILNCPGEFQRVQFCNLINKRSLHENLLVVKAESSKKVIKDHNLELGRVR